MTETAQGEISWYYKGRVEGREEGMRDKKGSGLERQTDRQTEAERAKRSRELGNKDKCTRGGEIERRLDRQADSRR